MGILAAKLLKRKCLIEEIGSPVGRSKLAHIVLRKVYSLADGCIFVSKNVKKEFTKLRYTTRKPFVIYNPVKKEFFIKNVKKSIPLSTQKIKIISAFRMEKEKNVFAIPDIAFELLKRNMQFDWDVFGEGSLKNQLHHKNIALNTHKHVKLKGFIVINPRVLRKYNVLVLTSKQEGMGIIVAEALALGLSVVATAVGGIPEIFQSKILKSCLVYGSNPEDFADKIIQSIQPKFTRAFVNHQKLCYRYHPDIYKKRLVNVYKNILKI
jgi:glycosyltransferase involved in cell wall biosynthesis